MEHVVVYATCPGCDGNDRIATYPDGPRTEHCTECKGLGLVPSIEGRAILALLRLAGLTGLTPDE